MTIGYPPSLPRVNQTAPVPRRIRGVVNGQTALDTVSALYARDWPHYPQSHIPIADVDPDGRDPGCRPATTSTAPK